jgi:hypothetical protein
MALRVTLTVIKQRAQKLFAEPGSDSAGKFQVLAFVKANEQGAEMLSRPFRFGVTANDEFLLFMELDFDPCSGLFPGFVSRVGALTDQAFKSQSADQG